MIIKGNFSPIKPPADIALTVHTVERPPTWRQQPFTLSYLLVNREVNAHELVDLMRWAVAENLPNPRVITPELIKWSSLFHPRFFLSVRHEAPVAVGALRWVDEHLSPKLQALSRRWLQSLLFLSGVTLSAAIIQQRFSAGTIGSKLDRLWDAGTCSSSGLAQELSSLSLHDRVRSLAQESTDEIAHLLAIRETFMQVWECIASTDGVVETMHQSDPPSWSDGRFGFVTELRDKLGQGLQAVVAYGSSVSSAQFADIDALVIVDDPRSALLQLAGTSPTWLGKELNLGIYSPAEFLVMQRLSGDNLSDYGVCLCGAVEVVRKPVSDLLARNFSFGVVRQRQQLGMLSRDIAAAETIGPDRQNLYEYFVKIPANVAKGTFGAVGKRLPKEQVHAWLLTTLGCNTTELQHQVRSGNEIEALATSSLATGHTLTALNNALNVVRDDNRAAQERSTTA